VDEKSKARGRAFTHAESRGKLLATGDHLSSAMEWPGVRDKPTRKREARLLTKQEQPLYSGCVKALPLAYSGPIFKNSGVASDFSSLISFFF